MMYCYNCEKTFDADEIVQKLDRETGELLLCCPHCGVDDIADTKTCSVCGREDCVDGEIHSGICLDCLWDAITYDVALEFMVETNTLHRFLLEDWLLGGDATGLSVSIKLSLFLQETFKRFKANDLIMDRKDFLEACKLFCLPNYPSSFGIEGGAFAEWYEDHYLTAI